MLPTSRDEWPELGSKETVSLRSGGGRQSIKNKDYVYNDGISSSLLEIFIKMLLINSVLSYCTILMLFSRIECVHHDVTKLYNRGLLNFYIYQWGEVDLEINLFKIEVSSPVASFVLKIQHFKFPNFHIVRDTTMVASAKMSG